MSTLGIMKARIAEEIYRDDLTSAIAREIASAVRYYQSKTAYFQERDSFEFQTVAGQDRYSYTDAAEIANLISIDYVHLLQAGSVLDLKYDSPANLDLIAFTPSQGVPSNWTYASQTLRLYPVPNDAYTVRIMGLIPAGMPQADETPNNPWMQDAEELIRSRAKRNLYLHSLGDQGMAAAMKAAEDEALASLAAETSMRTQVNAFVPYCI